jgi:transposase
MTAVMIGVDPHKASHTAVAINAAEEPLGQLRVCASADQAQRLLAWAEVWPERPGRSRAPTAWVTCWPSSC